MTERGGKVVHADDEGVNALDGGNFFQIIYRVDVFDLNDAQGVARDAVNVIERIDLTVIGGAEGTEAANALRRIFKERYVNGGDVSLAKASEPLTCSIQSGHPSGGSFEFSGGTCLSGAAGISANGQGKMGGNTYTFAFENIV